MSSDIEIAQAATLQPITEIAAKIGLLPDEIEQYGRYKAKIPLPVIAERLQPSQLQPAAAPAIPQPAQQDRGVQPPTSHSGADAVGAQNPPQSKLVLVTSINPTPAGEGKTTVTVGLSDGLRRLNKDAVVALREPSLDPVFGIKGGATGGGYAQAVPIEDINLHFTGDIHALTVATNTIAAFIDNHLQHGNHLHIDTRRIVWKRALDVNDRALRQVTVGLGGRFNSVPREDGFDVTAASELMAVLCLARSYQDLSDRIARMVVAYNTAGDPITVDDLGVTGAVAALLRDALKPNLVQTLEGTPVIMHGGPFANISIGCNSVLATRAALALGDIALTEAGFGSDLGGEKFLDIMVPEIGKAPDAIVVVVTLRSIKMHGGVALNDLGEENLAAVRVGFTNVKQHVENMRKFGPPVIVAINKFANDYASELDLLTELCGEIGVPAALTEVWAHGGKGAEPLAQTLLEALYAPANSIPNPAPPRPKNESGSLESGVNPYSCGSSTPNTISFCGSQSESAESNVKVLRDLATPLRSAQDDSVFTPIYTANQPLADKIQAVVREIYRGGNVKYTPKAQRQSVEFEKRGWGNLPVCIAKTQYSFSDNPKELGAPRGFDINVTELIPKIGAGFIVVRTGDTVTMPGLPKVPAGTKITLTADGQIQGLS